MTRLRDIGEMGLIARLVPRMAAASGDLLVGAGEDDSAAWREADGSITVATCDTAVEGVHFELSWLRPEDVGWRMLAMALGDLAAKGARPTYGMVAASLPVDWPVEAVDGVYAGMQGLAAEAGLRLVGGDTTRTPGAATFTLALLGRTPGPVVPRSAARPGWRVAVTGGLGAAESASIRAMRGLPVPPEWDSLLRRPRPRLGEGVILARAGLCCGDISDGLLRELHKFQAASGTGAVLRWDSVPRAEGVSEMAALTGGEEVELVCAGPPEAFASLPELGVALTEVGELTATGRVEVLDAAGRLLDLPMSGYDHFA